MISFCTTCMNRLEHLRQTLPQNIESAMHCDRVEFILLDYGSSEDIEGWIKDAMFHHIESGLLKFYRTKLPKTWCAAHAKNICHRAASGQVLCNLDSDVFIPYDFPHYLMSKMRDGKTIMAFPSKDIYGNDGTAGMVVVQRHHFESVNGYDESLKLGWTCEDMHLQYRCRMQNGLNLFESKPLCFALPHSNAVRLANSCDRNIKECYEQGEADLYHRTERRDFVANKDTPWGRAGDLERLSRQGVWERAAKQMSDCIQR